MHQYINHKVENYRASMVLGAVGDAMGYKNGDWEFLTNGSILHDHMMKMTEGKGPLALKIDMSWKYSDDTVMHIATAKGLINKRINTENKKGLPIKTICTSLAIEYKKCWERMAGRAPGKTTGRSIKILDANGQNWDRIPYNDRGCGCGASMRSACIGLVYYDDLKKLVAISIESGRITHHNPVAYLGAVISSYFTALAIEGVDPNAWMAYFMSRCLPQCESYIRESGREVNENLGKYWKDVVNSLRNYAQMRGLCESVEQFAEKPKKATFPENYGVKEREHFYHKIAWGAWPGALGIDSVLIAYDAFLSAQGNWEQLCLRAILHGGDNDSTGTIAGAWFGAMYGFQGVPENHYLELEDRKKLVVLGQQLYYLK